MALLMEPRAFRPGVAGGPDRLRQGFGASAVAAATAEGPPLRWVLAPAALLAALLTGAAATSLPAEGVRIESSDEVMGTTFSVVAYGDDRTELEAAAQAALQEAHRLDRLLSNYHASSEWSRVNRLAAGEPVVVLPELFDLLAASLEYSRQSDGAFDITVGPLMKLWNFYKGEGALPGANDIVEARGRVGYRGVRLDPSTRTVRFDRPGIELDPGGIGKGYAVDRMVARLKGDGVTAALVSAGGSSIYGLGAPPDDPRGWRIPIRDPYEPTRTATEVVLRDSSVSTSGSYEKFFRANGRTYSHIMDPRTGRPAQGTASVSVVAPRTVDSEVWTKPYFVNGRAWTAAHVPASFRVFFCEDGQPPRCGWIPDSPGAEAPGLHREYSGAQMEPRDFSPGVQPPLKVELVAEGFPGGEGPVWSREGFLIFSDYSRDRLYKYVPGKAPEVYREDSQGANGNTIDRRGRLYSCEYKSRRVTRTDWNGRVEVLVDRFEGKRFNAPNDIVVRRDGHIYFTDPLFTPLDQRDMDYYGVYHVTPAGQIEALARWQTRPNGIALSPDGRVLYVANTDERNIKAFDLSRDGRASNERVAVANLDGGPDGIRVDRKGNIYVTARGVQIYSPTGVLIGRIAVPINPRNLAFGDKDLKTLYLVGNSVYRVRVDTPGSVQY